MTNILLFTLVPVVCIILILTSSEQIPIFLEDTKLKYLLIKYSYPNSIFFNLSIGYFSGVFVYFLTGYIPERKRKKIQSQITLRLLQQVLGRLNSIFSTILKCTEKQNIDLKLDLIDETQFKRLCKGCNINKITDTKKILQENPLLLGDVLVREKLVTDWNFMLNYLDEIDMASIYIDPEIYQHCLKIRKSSISITLQQLTRDIRNTDLEAWSSQLYDLYILKVELDRIIDKILKKYRN